MENFCSCDLIVQSQAAGVAVWLTSQGWIAHLKLKPQLGAKVAGFVSPHVGCTHSIQPGLPPSQVTDQTGPCLWSW